jgi:hypothetical protein
MLLSEWRKTAPNRECMSNKVVAVLKPVLADLGAAGDPACWVLWGEDPEFRYSVMAPTPAGLVTVAVRVNGAGAEGPRATGKLIRWGKLQVSDLAVESADGHRLVAIQIEGQVLKGIDDEADRICDFVLGLLAAVDGRAFQVAAPTAVQAVPPVVAVAKPAAVEVEEPKVAPKPGPKVAPVAAPAAGAGKPAAKVPATGPARGPAKEVAVVERSVAGSAAARAQAGQDAGRQDPGRLGGSASDRAARPARHRRPPSRRSSLKPRGQASGGRSRRPRRPPIPPRLPRPGPAEPPEGGPVWEVPGAERAGSQTTEDLDSPEAGHVGPHQRTLTPPRRSRGAPGQDRVSGSGTNVSE